MTEDWNSEDAVDVREGVRCLWSFPYRTGE